MTTTTMPFFTVDTLQFSNRLQKAGLDRKISEEIAEAIKETQMQSTEGLATKLDIISVKKDLEILDHKIESLEYKLTVKMFVMLIAAVSLVTWLDKVIN
ncbi:MAG: hypothetical protein KGP29_04930 [Proteobacteria bacterium]|nr:hypothetical protein [Pseudomonadota bacterium]